VHGIIPLWKPEGMTSHACVLKIRRLLKIKKAGHTGTLDPNVSGVLPVCIGEATKIVRYLQDSGKTYVATVTLGVSTTTEDAEGEVVEEKKVERTISRGELLEVLRAHTGEIVQTPPMYSAVKVNGKRLYEYAREGIPVERPSRKVVIHELTLLDDREEFSGNPLSFSIRVACGKGTYIRTLAVSIGEKLGYPAHMSALTRISAAGIHRDACFTFEEIEAAVAEGRAEKILLPVEDVLSELPKYQIHDTLANRVKNGALLATPEHLQGEEGPVAVWWRGRIVAVYRKHSGRPGMLKPERVFAFDEIFNR